MQWMLALLLAAAPAAAAPSLAVLMQQEEPLMRRIIQRPGDDKLAAELAAVREKISAAYLRQGDARAAIDYLHNAVRLAPTAARWELLGDIAQMGGSALTRALAEEAYLRALERAPDLKSLHEKLGAFYLALGRPDLAKDYYERLTYRKDAEPTTAYLAPLGAIYSALDDEGEGIRFFAKAIKAGGADDFKVAMAVLHNQKAASGSLFSKLSKDKEDAMNLLQEVVAAHPKGSALGAYAGRLLERYRYQQ